AGAVDIVRLRHPLSPAGPTRSNRGFPRFSSGLSLSWAPTIDRGNELAMSDDHEHPPVVFRIRVGRQEFTCKGHLVWEGGIVFAVAESADDGAFLPEKVRLEESDLELKHDVEL